MENVVKSMISWQVSIPPAAPVAGGAAGSGGPAPASADPAPEQITLKGQDTPGCLLSSRLRRTAELLTFRLPNNDNRIAPIFDPFRDCTPFTCR